MTEEVVRFESVVVPDADFEGLQRHLVPWNSHEDESLMPFGVQRLRDVPRPTLVLRAETTPVATDSATVLQWSTSVAERIER